MARTVDLGGGLLRRRPATATLVGGALVIAGILLADVSWWFFILSGLGACGPGILRELGVLQDQDERARRASQRAGLHAFLATGLLGFVLVAFLRSGDRDLRNPGELATLLLAVLWFVYLLSSLLGYWGARKASTRMLLGFGFCWLAFTQADAGGRPLDMLMAALPSLPFFALAWLARRWPKPAGVLMIAVAAALYMFFGFWSEARSGGLIVNTGVAVLLCGPLVGCGLALLREKGEIA
jgi:hypothetical protein